MQCAFSPLHVRLGCRSGAPRMNSTWHFPSHLPSRAKAPTPQKAGATQLSAAHIPTPAHRRIPESLLGPFCMLCLAPLLSFCFPFSKPAYLLSLRSAPRFKCPYLFFAPQEAFRPESFHIPLSFHPRSSPLPLPFSPNGFVENREGEGEGTRDESKKKKSA